MLATHYQKRTTHPAHRGKEYFTPIPIMLCHLLSNDMYSCSKTSCYTILEVYFLYYGSYVYSAGNNLFVHNNIIARPPLSLVLANI